MSGAASVPMPAQRHSFDGLFRTIAHKTQKIFDYEAGRSLDEKPPLSEFREDEFKEVVGIDWLVAFVSWLLAKRRLRVVWEEM